MEWVRQKVGMILKIHLRMSAVSQRVEITDKMMTTIEPIPANIKCTNIVRLWA